MKKKLLENIDMDIARLRSLLICDDQSAIETVTEENSQSDWSRITGILKEKKGIDKDTIEKLQLAGYSLQVIASGRKDLKIVSKEEKAVMRIDVTSSYMASYYLDLGIYRAVMLGDVNVDGWKYRRALVKKIGYLSE